MSEFQVLAKTLRVGDRIVRPLDSSLRRKVVTIVSIETGEQAVVRPILVIQTRSPKGNDDELHYHPNSPVLIERPVP